MIIMLLLLLLLILIIILIRHNTNNNNKHINNNNVYLFADFAHGGKYPHDDQLDDFWDCRCSCNQRRSQISRCVPIYALLRFYACRKRGPSADESSVTSKRGVARHTGTAINWCHSVQTNKPRVYIHCVIKRCRVPRPRRPGPESEPEWATESQRGLERAGENKREPEGQREPERGRREPERGRSPPQSSRDRRGSTARESRCPPRSGAARVLIILILILILIL